MCKGVTKHKDGDYMKWDGCIYSQESRHINTMMTSELYFLCAGSAISTPSNIAS